MKNKFTIIGIILTTIILAGIAIFTAMKLYQTKDQAIAPNVPSSKPAAQQTSSSCTLSFTLTTPTSTATATSTSTATATSTATPTSTATATSTSTASPVPQCNNTCTSNTQCPSNLICYIPSGSTTGNCRNTQCLTESDCVCNPTPTATSTSTSVTNTTSPTEQPSLPDAGTTWPTVVATIFGFIVIFGSLLLAL